MIDIQAIRDRAKSPDPYANLQVLDLCDEVERRQWISVEKRTPSSDDSVLVWDGEDYFIADYCGLSVNGDVKWDTTEGWIYNVLYWMPLPEPPEDSDEKV